MSFASPTAAPEDRQPLTVHCGDCKHTWTAAYLPMEMGKVARLLKSLRCPSCAGDAKRIFCGPAPESGGADAD